MFPWEPSGNPGESQAAGIARVGAAGGKIAGTAQCMKSWTLGGCLCATVVTAANAQVLHHRDLLIGFSSGTQSGIYAVDPISGTIRGLVSGSSMKSGWPPSAPRGSGAVLSTQPSLVTTRSGGIYVAATSSSKPALARVDSETGNRSAVIGGWPSYYSEAGALALLDQRTIVAGSLVGVPQKPGTYLGALFQMSLASNSYEQIAGGLMSEGPAFASPMSIAPISRSSFYVGDYPSFGASGPAVLKTSVQTHTTTITTIPSSQPILRSTVTGGNVSSSPVPFLPANYGSGPVCDSSAYRLAIVDGSLAVCVNSQLFGYTGGIVNVDDADGGRSLTYGFALDAQNQTVSSLPLNASDTFTTDPSTILPYPNGEIIIAEWYPLSRIIAFNPSTRLYRVVADFSTYYAPAGFGGSGKGLAIYTNCPADINLDGVADDSDFSEFVVAYDILDCADAAMPLPCPSDLNADGLVDDSDFSIFVVGYDALLCE